MCSISLQISPSRRVTIQEFKNITMVSLREFYEKDGKTLPGKSGINLTIDQFQALLVALDDIKVELKGRGIDVDAVQGEDEEEKEGGEE